MATKTQTKATQADDTTSAAVAPAEGPKPPVDVEPKFSRERVLGPDGVRITGQPGFVLVGALEGDERREFTREEIITAVSEFLAQETQTEGVA